MPDYSLIYLDFTYMVCSAKPKMGCIYYLFSRLLTIKVQRPVGVYEHMHMVCLFAGRMDHLATSYTYLVIDKSNDI